MSRGRHKTIASILKWHEHGFSVKANALEHRVSEKVVRQVLKGEEPDDFGSEAMTVEEYDVRRSGYAMLKRPPKGLIDSRFGGDEAAYVRCVENVFGISAKEPAIC